MIIKEIVLEGFKSYSTRTVIQGFDCHFNAITGLNGSGKSNVLDAICFVLGISMLSVVRVTNMQELIYKNGQAGVTKANVTILFDNTDKNRSHEAYKKFDQISVRREISVGGGSKYTINGTKVTAEKVKQLFVMSGLNVNNANFLIMQGRITQVIRMKPREILSLVEETAGTNVFETNKRKAMTLVEKKDKKLKEIDDILVNDLTGKIEKLREEHEKYQQWRKLHNDTEKLERIIIAYNYQTFQSLAINAEDIIEQLKNEQQQLIQRRGLIQREKDEVEHQFQELRIQLDGNELSDEQKKVEGAKQRVQEVDGQIQQLLKDQDELKGKDRQLKTQIDEKKQKLVQGHEEIEAQKLHQDKFGNKVNDLESYIEDTKSKLDALRQGIEIEDTSTSSRINNKKDYLRRQEHEKQTSSLKLKEFQLNINNKKALLREATNTIQGSANEMEVLRKEIQEIQANLQNFNKQGIENEIGRLRNKKQEVQERIDQLESERQNHHAGRFDLSYADPEPNFDRSKVMGRVIRLIQLNDKRYAKALEAVSGGSFWSIVVDTDATGQVLLKRKTFGNVRLLPNNKMVPKAIPDNLRRIVNERFGRQAVPAIELISFDRQIHNSIGFVFGGYFVCENREVAQRIAYDPDIRRLAVSLDGDMYDPQGSVSGGSARHEASSLTQLARIVELENQIMDYKRQRHQIQDQLKNQMQDLETIQRMENELMLKQNQLQSKERMAADTDINNFESQIKELEIKAQATVRTIEEIDRNIIDLQKEISELENDNSSRRRSQANTPEHLENLLKKLEKDHTAAAKNHKKAMEKCNDLANQMQSLSSEIDEDKRRLNDLGEEMEENEKYILDLQRDRQERQEIYQQLEAQYSSMAAELRKSRNEYKGLERKIKEIEKKQKQTEEQIEQNKQKKQKTEKDAKNAYSEIQNIEKLHHWVIEERDTFGEGEFNFEGIQIDNIQTEYEKTKEEMEHIGKRVNKKVSSTLHDHLQHFEDLQSKRDLLIHDKETLTDLIAEIDSKKQACIDRTITEVDRNLGEIYSTLLPGATARLTDSSNGLVMQVGFNGVWKDNLSELSGGQRSLLALTFILSLLKYNPAPIYILDEIDAALDLSHTQNIGALVQRHFSQSQFIVVSLKEGMFTNANVLFRTQFIEGRSVIERHALRQNSADEERNRARYHQHQT